MVSITNSKWIAMTHIEKGSLYIPKEIEFFDASKKYIVIRDNSAEYKHLIIGEADPTYREILPGDIALARSGEDLVAKVSRGNITEVMLTENALRYMERHSIKLIGSKEKVDVVLTGGRSKLLEVWIPGEFERYQAEHAISEIKFFEITSGCGIR